MIWSALKRVMLRLGWVSLASYREMLDSYTAWGRMAYAEADQARQEARDRTHELADMRENRDWWQAKCKASWEEERRQRNAADGLRANNQAIMAQIATLAETWANGDLG